MTEPSDVELAARLGSDDPAARQAAFATLFDRHRQKAFDLAWRVLGDAGLAADAVQEALLTLYRKGPRVAAQSGARGPSGHPGGPAGRRLTGTLQGRDVAGQSGR